MAVNDKKLPKKENSEQVQIKLIRSQARGLWVTSSFAIVVSLASLTLSYYVHRNAIEEFCSVNTTLINEDYETHIGGLITSGSEGKVNESFSVSIKYSSETINLSKEPITLVSYYIINEGDIDGHKIDNLDWEEIIKKGDRLKLIESKLPNSVKIDPGDAYTFIFDTYIEMDNNTYKLIRNQLKDYALENDFFHIADIMHLFYAHKKDMFGNSINCTLDSGRVTSYTHLSFDNLEEHSFYFVIKTAKENYFAKRVTWYNRDDFELPFAF